jgi:hypothetical protein
MAYVRCRIFAEPAGPLPVIREYQEVIDITGGPRRFYSAGIEALTGYAATVDEHSDVTGHPHALVLIIEPAEPPKAA